MPDPGTQKLIDIIKKRKSNLTPTRSILAERAHQDGYSSTQRSNSRSQYETGNLKITFANHISQTTNEQKNEETKKETELPTATNIVFAPSKSGSQTEEYEEKPLPKYEIISLQED